MEQVQSVFSLDTGLGSPSLGQWCLELPCSHSQGRADFSALVPGELTWGNSPGMRPSRRLTDTGPLRIESGGNISFVHPNVKQLLMWLHRTSHGLGEVDTEMLAERSSCCSWDSQQLKSGYGPWICPEPISSTNQEIIRSNLALFQSTSNVLFIGFQNWARPIPIPLFTWPSRGVSLNGLCCF